MTNESIVSEFMARQYSDEKLAALLAWTEDGGLAFDSCCCFIGLVTADHAFRREQDLEGEKDFPQHYHTARLLPGAELAEDAFDCLGDTDEERRAKLIPLIKAEMERRDQERSLSSSVSLVSAGV